MASDLQVQSMLDQLSDIEKEIDMLHPMRQRRELVQSIGILGLALGAGIFESIGWVAVSPFIILTVVSMGIARHKLKKLQRQRDRLLDRLDEPTSRRSAMEPAGAEPGRERLGRGEGLEL